MTDLNIEEAAEQLGITPDELLRSFYRGLAPGSLAHGATGGVEALRWKATDLDQIAEVPSDGLDPEKLDQMAGMVQKIAESTLQCIDCGFQAKSKGGLTVHRRKHG